MTLFITGKETGDEWKLQKHSYLLTFLFGFMKYAIGDDEINH